MARDDKFSGSGAEKNTSKTIRDERDQNASLTTVDEERDALRKARETEINEFAQSDGASGYENLHYGEHRNVDADEWSALNRSDADAIGAVATRAAESGDDGPSAYAIDANEVTPPSFTNDGIDGRAEGAATAESRSVNEASREETSLGASEETPASATAPGGLVRVASQEPDSVEEHGVVDRTDPVNTEIDLVFVGGVIDENDAGAIAGSLSATGLDAPEGAFFSIADDASGLFEIVDDVLKLKDGVSADFESQAEFTLTIQVTDGDGDVHQELVTININDIAEPGGPDDPGVTPPSSGGGEDENAAPTSISLSGGMVDENDAGAVAGRLTSTDPDAGDTATYSIVNDPSGFFEVVGDTLKLKDGVSVDFEAQSEYTVTIEVVDGDGAAYRQDVKVAVGDVDEASGPVVDPNHAPSDIDLSGGVIDENDAGAVVGTLTATDVDAGDTATFSIADDASGLFEIVGDQLKLKDGVATDFEAQNTYEVTIEVADEAGATYQETVTVNVANVNEAPTDIALSANSDNLIVGGSFEAPDVAGNGGNLLNLDGQLSVFSDYPSEGWTTSNGAEVWRGYEGVASSDGDQHLELDVYGGAQDSIQQSVSTEEGQVYNLSFDMRSRYDGAPETVEVYWNGVKIGEFGDNTGTWTTAEFSVVGTGGDDVLEFREPAGEDNGVGVLLDNVSLVEAPSAIAENVDSAIVGTLTSVDPDAGDTATYAIAEDASGLFEVVGDQLKLKDGVAADFEAQDEYTLTIEVTDAAGATYQETVTINVADVNEGPTDIELSGGTIDENDAGAVVGTLSSTDVDAGATATYAITEDASGLFEVVGDQLKLKDGASVDFEAQDEYTLTIEVTDDAGATHQETVTVNVADLNDAPTSIDFISTRHVVIENAGFEAQTHGDQQWAYGTEGWERTGSSGDWNPAARSLAAEASEGSNVAYINSGVLSQALNETFSESGDYTLSVDVGNRQDIGGFGNYEIRLYAGDELIGTADDGAPAEGGWQTVTLTVSGEDFPEGFSGFGENLRIELVNEGGGQVNFDNVRMTVTDEEAGLNVPENSAGAQIAILSTEDQDAGDSHTYSVSDDRFEVQGGVLKLKDGVALDHEAAESIDIVVTATDEGGRSVDQSFTVQIGDVNERPEDLALSGTAVDENDAGAIIGDLTLTDSDHGETHVFTVSDDRFEVVDGQLKLKDGVSLSHEDRETVSVTVTATDSGGLETSESFSINVADLNERPTDINFDTVREIAVENAGFEAQTHGDQQWAYGTEGWERTGSSGDWNPAARSLAAEASEGSNVAYINSGVLSQTLGEAFSEEGDYTLSVDVGNRQDISGFGNYEIRLYAGDELIGTADDGAPAEGGWQTVTLTVSGEDFPEGFSGFGENLRIELVNEGGGQVNFDNVRMTVAEQTAPLSVDENSAGAIVDQVNVIDEDVGDTHSFVVSDERFEIVDGQLKLKDGVSLDHETADTIELTITATDSGGLQTTNTFTVNVADVNEGPTDIELSGGTIDENDAGAVVGTLTSTDGDAGATATYAIADDASGLFEIVGDQLKLKDGVAADFEAQDEYTLTIEVTDDAGATYQETVTVNVTDVNEAPVDITLSGGTIDENDAGAVVGTLSATDVDAGATATYAIADDASGLFEVVGDQLKLRDGVAADFEAQDEYTLTIEVTDDAGATYQETVTVNVADVNEGPTDIELSGGTIDENDAGAVVGTLTSTDGDVGATATYAIADDASGLFEVVGDQLKLKDGVAADFEAQDEYTLTIEVTDDVGATYQETVTVNVADVNEGPTDIALSGGTIDENDAGAVVGTLTSTDVDAGATGTYAIADDASGLFEVVGDTLKLKDGVAADFEAQDEYTITIEVTDDAGATYQETVTVNVADVNEGPTDIALSANSDNLIVGGSFETPDVAGNGGNLLNLGGQLSVFSEYPSEGWTTSNGAEVWRGYEGVASSDGDQHLELDVYGGAQDSIQQSVSTEEGQVYNLSFDMRSRYNGAPETVEVYWNGAKIGEFGDDTGTWTTAEFSVVGTGGDDVLEFREPAGEDNGVGVHLDNVSLVEAPSAIAENVDGAIVGILTSSDPDAGDTASYAITDDASGLFEVVGDQLKLKDDVAADFETQDEYTLTIEVTDSGGATYQETVTVNVADVNEGPTEIVLETNDIREDAGGGVGDILLNVTDPDGDTQFTFTVSDDRFEVHDDNGEYTLRVKDGFDLDHETEPTVSLTVTATDEDGASYSQLVTLNVTDVNEAPMDITLSGGTIDENDAGAVVGTLTSTDVDAGATATYAIADDASGLFEVVGDQLKLKDGVAADFEAQDEYTLTIEVTDDAGATYQETVTVNVADVNEGPSDIELSGNTIDENDAGAVVGTLTSTDGDAGATATYAIADDASGLFEIVGDQLKLKDGVAADFEAQDAYTITIEVTDDAGATYQETVTVNVADVNEGPSDIELSGNTIDENDAGAVVGTLTSTDIDAGASATYAIADDASGMFEVVGDQLKLRDGVAADFEAQDAYTITIEVTDDAGATYQETVTVNVADVNEGPTDLFISNNAIAENSYEGAVVGQVTASDPDAGETFTFALVDDAGGRFTIDADTGQVTVSDRIDESILLDTEVNPSHDIVVEVTDSSGNTYQETVTIDVTDVVNEYVAGDAADNVLSGAGGNDVVYDTEGGDDVLAGGAGNDTIADIAGGDDELYGGAGDDILHGGKGADLIDGGEGTDTAYYSSSTEGVSIDLGAGEASGGDAAGDTITNVENIFGSAHDDTIAGDDGANQLSGYNGDDVLEGAGGDDALDGGAGNDTAVFSGNWSDYTITENDGTYTVVDNRPGSPDGTDTAVNVENFQFADGTVPVDEVLNVGPTDISPDNATVNENSVGGTVVATLVATDANALDAHQFTLTDDASDMFEIVGNEIRVKEGADLDFETAELHDVTIEVTDASGATYQETVTVNVADVNEGPTDIALSGGTINENDAGAVVGTLTSTDVDAGATATYAIADDASGLFEVVGDQLKLKDGVATDFEAQDEYTLTIEVTDDAGATYQETVTVNVADVNEGPTDIDLSGGAIDENDAGAVVGTLTAADVDAGDTATFTIADDASGLFEVVGDQLKLRDGVSADFEAQDEYALTIEVTDSDGATYQETISVNVADVSEGPTDIDLSGTSINENDTGAVVGTLTSSDDDAGATATYAITDDASGLFEIVGDTLKLKDGVSADFEAEDQHTLTIEVTDDQGATYQETVTVDVADVNEGPTDIELSGASIDENDAGAVVGTLTSTDVDAGDTASYAIAEDASGLFEIVGDQLKLKDGVSADFEAQDEYTVTVEVTDGDGATYQEALTIDVNDINETPTDIVLSNNTVDENDAGAAVGVLSTIDDAGDSASYVITDDASGLFEVVGDTLKLKDGVSADFEAQDEYTLTVEVTDSYGETYEETFTVNVADVNEGPTDIVLTGGAIAENDAGADVGTLSSSDPDAGDSATYSIVSDASGLFEVVGDTLKLKDGVSADFEAQDEHTLTIEVTDSDGATRQETMTVTVADVDEAPVVLGVDAGSTNEDVSAVISEALLLSQSSDPEGAVLSIQDVSVDPAHGSVSNNGDGTWTFTPTADFAANDIQIAFTVTDGTNSADGVATLDIEAVADTPELTIDNVVQIDVGSEGQTNSNFEGGGNLNLSSGSAFVTQIGDWETTSEAIEIKQETLADGSINQFLELNEDPINFYDDAANIQQTLETEDGAQYTVDFEYAPRPGYDDDVNEIEVVVNGEVVDTISADGSGDSSINWRTGSFTFTGDGSDATIEFRASGAEVDYGRGMYLDDITITEELPTGIASGYDGSPIELPDMSIQSGDADSSETVTLSISGIPDGFELSDGANSFTASAGETSIDVSGWSLDQMTITPTNDFSGEVDLTATATSTDGLSTASTSQTITLDVINDDEVIDGTSGLDIISGGTGEDTLSGGDGSDTFVYNIGDGSDVIDGGAGGGWTDVIQFSDGIGSLGELGVDWTLEITSGSIESQDSESIDLSDDAEGVITLQDGSTIEFSNIEQII